MFAFAKDFTTISYISKESEMEHLLSSQQNDDIYKES